LLELGSRDVTVEFAALDEASEKQLKEGSW
jgi:hypothetical protein